MPSSDRRWRRTYVLMVILTAAVLGLALWAMLWRLLGH